MKNRGKRKSKSSLEPYAAYNSFAWFYEHYWTGEVPPEILTVIEKLLLPRLPEGARVLDLCCGTGYTVGQLMKRGFKVTGVDGSKEMLKRARLRARSAELIHADAREFSQPPVYQAVISTFDSLNHILTLEELSSVFRNVRRALAHGGIFFFDLNTEEAFLENWVDYFAIVEDESACILRGSYDRDERIGRYDITMFRRLAKSWRRKDAVVLERSYTTDEIRRALRREGFKKISIYDAVTDVGLEEHVGRKFFLATQ